MFSKIHNNFKYWGVIEKWNKLSESSSVVSTLYCFFLKQKKILSFIITYKNETPFGVNLTNFSLSQQMGRIIYIL